MKPIIIIGSGLAGYTLAKEFRKLDTASPLHIITARKGHFYSKPLLSTALAQKRTAETLPMADAETMSKQLNATIHTETSVTKIDTVNQHVYFGKESLEYSKLVLACGADVIKPPLVGNAVNEILSVNDLEDYAEFRRSIHDKKHIAILGAGLVGCEFANDLIAAGHTVDVIAPSPYPLDRLLPEEVALVLQRALAAEGVHWHLEQLPTSVDKAADGYLITLSYQSRLKVDIVLSAIGLRPHIGLAEATGLQVNRGILVDRSLETSVKNIYALGDCAEVNGLVLLFVAPLLNCARVLAKTLAGEETIVDYPAMPVVLKTPACPIVVSPPPQNVEGNWQISGQGNDLTALFYDQHQNLRGFALTGTAVQQRGGLTKQLPPLFSE